MSETADQRGINRITAAILARTLCPEKADLPAPVAQEFLRLRCAGEDLDRFHTLLKGRYADNLTAAEEGDLESYLFVNCFVEMIRERAWRSLKKSVSASEGKGDA